MRRAKETSREARSQQRAWDWRAKEFPAIWLKFFPAIWLTDFRFLAHHHGSFLEFPYVLQDVGATSRPMRGQSAANARPIRGARGSARRAPELVSGR